MRVHYRGRRIGSLFISVISLSLAIISASNVNWHHTSTFDLVYFFAIAFEGFFFIAFGYLVLGDKSIVVSIWHIIATWLFILGVHVLALSIGVFQRLSFGQSFQIGIGLLIAPVPIVDLLRKK